MQSYNNFYVYFCIVPYWETVKYTNNIFFVINLKCHVLDNWCISYISMIH